MIRLSSLALSLPFRRKKRPRPRPRRYAVADSGSEAGNLFVFVGLFAIVGGAAGYIMGVPALHHGLPHLDPATLQSVLPTLHSLMH